MAEEKKPGQVAEEREIGQVAEEREIGQVAEEREIGQGAEEKELDLIHCKPNDAAKKLASFLAEYVLNLFKYNRILVFPDVYLQNKVGEASVLQAYRDRGLIKRHLKMHYPSCFNLKSHEIFLKTSFWLIYDPCKSEDGGSFGFLRICGFTAQMLLYLHERHLPVSFFESTVLLLARVFSSDEFNAKTDIVNDFPSYCRDSVEMASRHEHENIVAINKEVWDKPELKQRTYDLLIQLF